MGRHSHSSKRSHRDEADEGRPTNKHQRSNRPEKKLSDADFFAKNGEFSAWLRRKKSIYFDALTSKEARRYFRKFMDKYNEGELSEKYYDGTYTAASTSDRTGYTWKFATKLKKADVDTLSNIHASTDGDAAIQGIGKPSRPMKEDPKPSMPPPGARHRPMQGPVAPSPEELESYSQQWKQKERRDFRKEDRRVMDELVPKETGHAAKIQAKQGRAAERRAREQSPEMDEKVTMGSSTDSFRRAVEKRDSRQQHRREARQDAMRDRLSVHQEQEKAKLAALLVMAKANKGAGALWQG